MTGFARLAGAALFGAALLALGCGDSSAPSGPTTLVRVSGDSQSAVVSTTLPNPLTVRVTGAGSQPAPNTTVTWTVMQGTATLGAASSQTDSSGTAATTLTLGSLAERITVRAAVAALQPVTFTATACAFPAFTLDDTVSAALTTLDCKLGSYYTDFYSLGAGAQQGLTITLDAAFDTWLDLYRGDGAYLAFNDDIDPGVITDSRIEIIVAPGSYVIAPSTYDVNVVGPYAVSVVTRPQAVAGCALVWVTRGVTVTDSVTATDCADPAGTSFSDAVAIIALSGSVLTVAQRSAAINALLTLYRVDPNTGGLIFVTSNDDSIGTTTDAFISTAVPVSAVYVLFAGTSGVGETGGYTLAVSASATAAGVAAVPVAPLPVAPLVRMPKLSGWGSKPLPRSRRFR